jgi:UDP-glucose 4-epimerase
MEKILVTGGAGFVGSLISLSQRNEPTKPAPPVTSIFSI